MHLGNDGLLLGNLGLTARYGQFEKRRVERGQDIPFVDTVAFFHIHCGNPFAGIEGQRNLTDIDIAM